MKQHITTKQLNELNEKGLLGLYKWCLDKGYYFVREDLTSTAKVPRLLLSIGQMIEFLVEKQDKGWRDLHIEMLHNRWQVGTCHDEDADDGKWKFSGGDKGELCDTLWETTKEILEK